MGIKLFGNCSCNPTNNSAIAPNPDPEHWQLLEKREFRNSYVLMVKYYGCTNHEGVKVMVYKGQYQQRERLDPHFADDGSGPVARFEPTDWGWSQALKFAKSI